MKVLITGAHGQVASELLRLADHQKLTLFPKSKLDLDITNAKLVLDTINHIQPDIVINTAAYTQVDQSEEHRKETFAINCEGAKYLAIACEKNQIPLLHLSTDYVFDGFKKSPYLETDLTSPINVYGQSKWQGENEIKQYCSRYLIIRTSAVFGVHGVNFVKTMLRLFQEREIIRIVEDQTICPTPATEIAAILWELCEAIKTKPQWGIYHFCGEQAVTWYDFAKQIMTEFKCHRPVLTKEIQPITSDQYPTRAERPHYSVLDCHHLQNRFGIKAANWQKGLRDVITRLHTVPQE